MGNDNLSLDLEAFGGHNNLQKAFGENDLEKAKKLDPNGKWVTIDGRHVHIGSNGEVDAGKIYGKDGKDVKKLSGSKSSGSSTKLESFDKKTLNKQLREATGDGWDSSSWSSESGGEPSIAAGSTIVHKKTGKKFQMPSGDEPSGKGEKKPTTGKTSSGKDIPAGDSGLGALPSPSGNKGWSAQDHLDAANQAMSDDRHGTMSSRDEQQAAHYRAYESLKKKESKDKISSAMDKVKGKSTEDSSKMTDKELKAAIKDAKAVNDKASFADGSKNTALKALRGLQREQQNRKDIASKEGNPSKTNVNGTGSEASTNAKDLNHIPSLKDLKGDVQIKMQERDTSGMKGSQDKYEAVVMQDGKQVGTIGSFPQKSTTAEQVVESMKKSAAKDKESQGKKAASQEAGEKTFSKLAGQIKANKGDTGLTYSKIVGTKEFNDMPSNLQNELKEYSKNINSTESKADRAAKISKDSDSVVDKIKALPKEKKDAVVKLVKEDLFMTYSDAYDKVMGVKK